MTDIQTIMAEILLRQDRIEAQNRDLLAKLQTLRTELHSKVAAASGGWLDTRPAAAALGSAGIRNIKHLRELLYRGVFSQSAGEIRNTGSDKKPNWQFNIPKCERAIAHFYALPSHQQESQFPPKSA